jgi:DNA-binding GntR family transcriptional regulator
MSQAQNPFPAEQTLLRAQTLSEQASVLVRNSIVSGRFLPGQRFTVAAIARQLGVSVTPVREALMHLREAGLVHFNGSVYTIVPATEKTLRDAFDLREALDGMAARLAAQRWEGDDAFELTRLAGQSRDLASVGDLDGFRKSDTDFHHKVAASSYSPSIEAYLRNAYDLALTLRNVSTAVTGFNPDFAEDHQEIANAIAKRDPDGAERLARTHVRSVLALVLSGINS